MSRNPLKTLLPSFVSGMEGIAALLDTLDAEVGRWEDAALLETEQLVACTASHQLPLWEQELGLERRADLPVEERRALVLAALSFFGACSPQRLTRLLERMTGGVAQYSETPGDYTLSLATQTPGRVIADLPAIARAIKKTAPAHIFCSVAATGDMAAEPGVGHALYGAVKLALHSQ